MKNSRIDWIDIAKGWGMLFVMLHHFIVAENISGKSIFYAPFFLTVFFVASGMVFHGEKSFRLFLHKKMISLIIPLFILALIGIFSQKLLSFRSEIDIWGQVKNLFLQRGTEGYLLWYIAATFVVSVFFYFLIKIPGNFFYICTVLLVALNIILVVRFEESEKYFLLPWHIDLVGIGCFWMAVGYKMKEFLAYEHIKKVMSSFSYQVTVFILYITSLLISYSLFSITYISVFDIYVNPVLYFGINGLGVLWIFSFSMIRFPLPVHRFLTFIGKNTLFYFAFHGKVQSILQTVFYKLTERGIITVKINPIIPVLVIFEALVLIIPCIVFSKLFPFAVGKGLRWKKPS